MPTKEQVLKRMAQIEGIYCRWNQSGEGEYVPGWNPLDYPSDWAVLIEKYRLQIEPPSKFEEDCFSIRELWNVCPYDSNDGAKSESLPWAICLAIIESKGGMGDE